MKHKNKRTAHVSLEIAKSLLQGTKGKSLFKDENPVKFQLCIFCAPFSPKFSNKMAGHGRVLLFIYKI